MNARLALLPLLLTLSACATRIVVHPAASTPEPVHHSPSPVHSVQGPVVSLGVPPGHFPPPGQCRVWMPGVPPGKQAACVPCNSIDGDVPLGALVLHRPSKEKGVVQVMEYDGVTTSMIVSVAWYDAVDGRLLPDHPGSVNLAPGKRADPGAKGSSSGGKSRL
jgi:hypothetical protein